MGFWIAVTVTLVVAALAMAFGARRGRGEVEGAADMALYRDQLREVERDRARGTLSAEEAERIRLEVSRRLLAADKAAQAGVRSNRGPLAAALGLVALALAGGAGLYVWLGVPGYPDWPREARLAEAAKIKAERPSQQAMEAALPPWTAPEGADPSYIALVEKLRKTMEDGAKDPKGWELLTRNEEELGNYPGAWRAQEKLIGATETPTAADYARQADLMVSAAGGQVSPEAETALVEALKLDPKNRDARFYAGLLYLQTGRPDRAFRFWAPLLEEPGQGEPWLDFLRGNIVEVARFAGENRYQLPDAKGPSAADVAAAGEMSAEDRQAFIRSMVEGLSAELAEQGGPPEKWAQLIRSLGVLGETERAKAIWEEAQGTFAADPEGLATIRAAAEAAGVAG